MQDTENKEIQNPENNLSIEDKSVEYAVEEIEKKPRPRLPFWLGILVGFAGMTLVLFAFFLISGSSFISQSSSGYKEKLDILLGYLDKYYLYDLDEDEIADTVAKGLFYGLDDDYAVYYTKEEFDELKESVSGNYAGIGISIIQNDNGDIEVYQVYSESPAEKAGIYVTDLIVEAEGVRNFEVLDQLVEIVRGEPGTTVNIVIERNGKEIPMTIERANISIDTVSYEMLEGDIGYIYIAEFDTVTLDQFNKAIDDLESQGMKSLILDLRNNPGGDYSTVVAMCDRILPEGPIITVKDKNGTVKTEQSDAENQLNIPMVAIINGNSASASEVFVGALQDYGLATVVGEQSFGKGIVQGIYSLSDGSGMKFTTEEYFTPSGRSIHGVGITPDEVVELPEEAYEDGILSEEEDTQLKKAIDILRK